MEELQNQIVKYKILVKELGHEEDLSKISDEEAICVRQIEILRQQSDEYPLDADQIKNFDILHKNLRMIRGKDARFQKKDKLGQLSDDELIKAIKGQ